MLMTASAVAAGRGAGILCCDPSVKRRLLGGIKGGTVGLSWGIHRFLKYIQI